MLRGLPLMVVMVKVMNMVMDGAPAGHLHTWAHMHTVTTTAVAGVGACCSTCASQPDSLPVPGSSSSTMQKEQKRARLRQEQESRASALKPPGSTPLPLGFSVLGEARLAVGVGGSQILSTDLAVGALPGRHGVF